MNRKTQRSRANEYEWHTSQLHSRPMVPIGKPRPIRRANRLGRLVDWFAKLVDARRP